MLKYNRFETFNCVLYENRIEAFFLFIIMGLDIGL
jgi:hypothetical protein